MKTTPTSDPYKVLGLERQATDAQVKRAYFQLVRAYPPEREPDMFKKVRAAYERLQTPERRARTGLFLLQPPPALPARRQPVYDLSVHPEDLVTLVLEQYFMDHAPHEKVHEPEIPSRP